jgi:methionyl-tRNA formyltransferase
MKFVYFGTPDFSARLLERLMRAGMVPAAVVTNPDRPAGRKKIVTAPPVKRLIQRRAESGERGGGEIEILQPEKLDAAFMEKLKSFGADVFVVFAYNKIFRKEILAMPRLGVVGVHPSILPAYRGPSPFQTALLHGEKETGVTLYLLDEGIDAGPIIAASNPLLITDEDTFKTLAEKLADAGADLLIETLPKFIAGGIVPKPQDGFRATFTKKFKTEDGFVAPEDLAAAEARDARKTAALDRKIRALNPEPGVWTMQNGKRVKLLEAKTESDKLRLTKIQEEGQKPKIIETGPQ